MTKPAFDLILGVKTLRELGIVLDFETKEITIDEIILPMRGISRLSASSKIENAWSVNHSMIHELQSTTEATQLDICILDAKYEKAALQLVVDTNCPRLSLPDQNKWLDLLMKYKDLFGGTLGGWNTEPVSFELKEGVKPHHGRAYPVPHAHKETLKKELNRLCELWVLEKQTESEWTLPSFIVPKKIKLCIFSVILEM